VSINLIALYFITLAEFVIVIIKIRVPPEQNVGTWRGGKKRIKRISPVINKFDCVLLEAAALHPLSRCQKVFWYGKKICF